MNIKKDKTHDEYFKILETALNSSTCSDMRIQIEYDFITRNFQSHLMGEEDYLDDRIFESDIYNEYTRNEHNTLQFREYINNTIMTYNKRTAVFGNYMYDLHNYLCSLFNNGQDMYAYSREVSGINSFSFDDSDDFYFDNDFSIDFDGDVVYTLEG